MIEAAGLLLGFALASDCQRCPAVPPDAALDPARASLAQVYAREGQCSPCEDPVLSRAALAIAGAARQGLPEAVRIQREVQEAGGGDPAPRAMLVQGPDAAAIARDLEARWHWQASDQVLGLGASRQSGGLRLVVLSAERKVSVESLPDRVALGKEISITGTLLAALRSPAIYVESPDGSVTQIATTLAGAKLSARFLPGAIGKYAIEVMAQGARGPEVLFLKSVGVGVPAVAAEPLPGERRGHDDAVAVLDQINSERQRHGAAALAADDRLDKVAQAYARELRELGIFAHVSPRSGDLKARLKRANYPFRSAAENLAEGPTALEAQALAANSPAHRSAMLDAHYTRCGIGLSRVMTGEGRADVLLVEVFALDER